MSAADRPSIRTAAAAGNASRARTALHATGFGPPPSKPPRPAAASPDPSAYYPNEDDDADSGDGSPPTRQGGGAADSSPFPKLRKPRKVEEPLGIGTLFEARDEVIRELSSEEYLDLLRDWAPIASFASAEAIDDKIKEEALCTLTVLRGMAVSSCLSVRSFVVPPSRTQQIDRSVCVDGGIVASLACRGQG